ncbi:alpha/beta fold hydrolase [Labrys neptuniae]
MNPTRRLFLNSAVGLAALALHSSLVRAAPRTTAGPASAQPSATAEPFSARSADGTVLAGDIKGDPAAPEILFVHGLRQSRLSWDKQFADPALSGFRLVRFDLRGHGDSDKPASLDAYSDAGLWADDVAAVIAAAGLRRPILVGWSLGGFVAGAYLNKYGGSKIAGVNLVDAVTKLSPDLLTPLAGSFTKTATSHDLAERTAATAEFLAACFHQPLAEAELQRMLVVNGMTARAVNEGFIKTTTTDLEPVFKTYPGPILLTHGVHDRLVRLTMSERIKTLRPDSLLSVYAESGHSPFYEEPVRYGRELAAFTATSLKG